jgi:hypothetical protein
MNKEELDLLLNVISKYNGKKAHVEIGTAAGGTLWRMMNCFGRKNHPPFLVVDPMGYFLNQLETVRNNLTANNANLEKVEFRQIPSSEALIQARKSDEKFSFILIDGRHKIRYVMEDLMWGELIEAGGLLCLHDYTEAFPGVMKSVNWFIKNNPHYTVEAQAGSLLVLRKDKESDSPEVGTFGIFYAWCWAPYLQILPSILKRVNKYKHILRDKRKCNNGA